MRCRRPTESSAGHDSLVAAFTAAEGRPGQGITMVMPVARSLSSRHGSHCSYEAELEGAILQQTASVDYYLQTAAPRWSSSSGCAAEYATRQELQALFLNDMQSLHAASIWHFPPAQSEISCFEDSLQPAKVQSGLVPSSSSCRQPPPHAPILLHAPTRKPRRQPQQPGGAGAHLEQFLEDDVQRVLHMQEQLAQEAAASDAAVLASTAEERRRRLSSASNSSISFVRLPDHGAHEAAEDEEADAHSHHAVAAALAAATAIAAVDNLVSSPASPSAALRCAAGGPAPAAVEQPPAAAAAVSAQLLEVADEQAAGSAGSSSAGSSSAGSSSSGSASRPAPATYTMEADEDIAAQKAAARTRLAELQQQDAASRGAEVAGSGGKACCGAEGDDWAAMDAAAMAAGGRQPGSMHSSVVPERPRGLAGKAHHAPQHAPASFRALLGQLLDKALGAPQPHHVLGFAGGSGAALQQQGAFLQAMRTGLLLCLLLLPVLWLLQPAGPGGSGGGLVRSMLPPEVAARAEQLFSTGYVAGAACLLLYLLARSLLLQPALMHFGQPELEARYLLWSNSSKVVTDCLLQLVSLLAGCCLWQRLQQDVAGGDEDVAAGGVRLLMSCASLLGTGLPVLSLLLMRSRRYVAWREQLLAGSRLGCILGLSALQLALPEAAGGGFQQLQLSMPFVALAQLMSIACMQVRLCTFLPFQVLQLMVLLARTKVTNPLLHLVQLFGGGLCLPCLLLHRMELHSRRAFLAACAGPGAQVLHTPKAV